MRRVSLVLLKERKEKGNRMNLNRLPYGRYLLPMSFIVMLLVSAFAISSLVNLAAAEENKTTDPYFEVDPDTSVAANGGSFTIDIYARNAPTSTAWQLTLDWDGNVLNATAIGLGDDPLNNLTKASNIFQPPLPANESITIGQAMKAPYTFSGTPDIRLCSVTFLVLANATSVLNLTDTFLIDSAGVTTHYPNNDGFFHETTATFHDVAVIDVSLNATQIAPDDTLNITVVVKNQGNYTQNVSVSVYADVVAHNPADPDDVDVGNEITIATYSFLNLAPGSNDTTSVYWTPGANTAAESYYISAEATKTDPATDDDPHDNILIAGPVKILVPVDIRIWWWVKFLIYCRHDWLCRCRWVVRVIPFSEVDRGETLYFNVSVQNQGTAQQSFNVTLDANGTTFIDWLTTNLTLAAGASTIVELEWDTTNFAAGDWNITATVVPLAGERPVDVADNKYSHVITVNPVYDRIVSSVATVTPEIWTGKENGIIRITVRNGGTEPDTFNVTLYADHLRCYILDATGGPLPYGHLGKLEFTLQPGEVNVTTVTWKTKGTWVQPANTSHILDVNGNPCEDSKLPPEYKKIIWTKCHNRSALVSTPPNQAVWSKPNTNWLYNPTGALFYANGTSCSTPSGTCQNCSDWKTAFFPYGIYGCWLKTTDFVVRSEVYGGSYDMIVFADLHPDEVGTARQDNNRDAGLPIIVKQIVTDANLDGYSKSDDGILGGKLLLETRPPGPKWELP